MCDCIAEIDKALALRNTRLSKALMFSPPRTSLMIASEVMDKKRGARAVTVFASYCPFCGTDYEKKQAGGK